MTVWFAFSPSFLSDDTEYSQGLSSTHVGSEACGRSTICETVSAAFILDVYIDWLDSAVSNLGE